MRCIVYPQIPITFIMAQTVYKTLISHTVFHIKSRSVKDGTVLVCRWAVNVFALISFSSGWGTLADILMSSLLGSQVELWSSHYADLVKMECNRFAASDFDQVTWYNQSYNVTNQLQDRISACGLIIIMHVTFKCAFFKSIRNPTKKNVLLMFW